jgi:hypothetical protein
MLFIVALSAPIAVHAKDPILPGEEQALAPASIPGPSVSVEDSRVNAAQQALLSPDLGSMQEDALTAIVATGESWHEITGSQPLKTSRATVGHLTVSTTAESSRVAAAQLALLSGDLGSMQEEALAAVVAPGTAPDEASVDDALAADRAALLALFRAVKLSSSSSLGADQHLSPCAAAS